MCNHRTIVIRAAIHFFASASYRVKIATKAIDDLLRSSDVINPHVFASLFAYRVAIIFMSGMINGLTITH